ncbi:putative sporulation protein YyaC [Bacillus ectoiniformans]|uniref:spore protease YyaC n=1 Tax=Bacillus ectoiniformans TaxID=1494429 RepID=UPI00195B4FAC|nr:spore protease YyaC [Bacillus ectoiniformans]MBM7648147.1 putative sporulation protein YyaC [Bacillus ectoiniformans]
MNLKRFFDRSPDPFVFHYEHPEASKNIAEQLLSLLPPPNTRPIILVFIGTDRSTGDSLGPLTGTLLSDQKAVGFHIYGTLEDPVHAVNLTEKLAIIHKTHRHPFIIGADACLGRLKSIGNIQIGAGPVKPGAGVNKELPAVGEAHITGVVNVSGFMEFFVLQNTRLHLVMSMAKVIASGVVEASIGYQRMDKDYFLPKKPDVQ